MVLAVKSDMSGYEGFGDGEVNAHSQKVFILKY